MAHLKSRGGAATVSAVHNTVTTELVEAEEAKQRVDLLPYRVVGGMCAPAAVQHTMALGPRRLTRMPGASTTYAAAFWRIDCSASREGATTKAQNLIEFNRKSYWSTARDGDDWIVLDV